MEVSINSGLKKIQLIGVGTPLLLVMILSMMTLPMPTFVLDILFSFNITLALIVILVTVYAKKPLDFAAFPTVLLIATLLRLALNVGSTRVVLLNGHNGPGAAGTVIQSFGEVVVGGNYAVGIIVFAILVIINFVVVTKGAGRISEVSARFTLDAMPGKQMAIDADLNAGILTQEEAKLRREEISLEADFYGSMDGASKFVRGDAIAGILILFINIIGGVAIGMGQHDLDFGTAMKYYALLTIGDGLVAQIPALLLSTAAAIMVTRTNSSIDIGTQILSQLFAEPKSLIIAASILGMLGIIPGMPHIAFLSIAAIAAGGAWYIKESNEKAHREKAKDSEKEVVAKPVNNETRELTWDDVQPVDPVGLEVGYRLIPLVDQAQDGTLMGRIKGVRKKLSQELGFLMPSVHIRDNLDLTPNAYKLILMGVTVGEAEIHPDRELAINPGQIFGEIEGIKGKDPAFGLEAVWIEPSMKDQAQSLGYTVVDASTVVATHLSQILQEHAHELLGHEEVEQLLKKLSQTAPKLVENLVPDILPLGTFVKVLQNLLLEHVPIRDLRTIAETLADCALRSQEPGILTATVRIALSRMIVQNLNTGGNEISVITLEPSLEQILQQSIQVTGDDAVGIEPGLAERLQKSLQDVAQRQEIRGQTPVLLTAPAIRTMLARFARFGVPNLHVLSYQEIPDTKQVKIVATVGQ